MGRRYQAILKYLGEPFGRLDVLPGFKVNSLEKYDRFIVATPTSTHLDWVNSLDLYKKPILCEKPLSTHLDEVEEILKVESPLSMTMQYRYFDREFFQGESGYDFYNHGKDGLAWDCFQIIALARGEVSVREESPIWKCRLNGEWLDLAKMDHAYVWAVKNFLEGQYLDREHLHAWHSKVKAYSER
jgi:hypothetical protein